MVSNRRLVPKEGSDYYPTPPFGTKGLMENHKFYGTILEPCCGDGAMCEVLKEYGHEVIASDLHDRGYGEVKDFFHIHTRYPNIITNPPFNIAADIFDHAWALATEQVALLLRTAFLESSSRYNTIFRDRPPSKVLVFSERLSMYPAGYEVKGGGTTSYAWFIWNKLNTTETKLEWIAPGLKPKGRHNGRTA